ncbi:ABC transporter permease [Actinomadura darangshiensis]|uniref:ABC transporter permease n=1 Tax=Actinomadura darangshiensis TaxID=705336 RepID=A0A4R5BND0_9ACTN|nr:ABC transporter permease [Actinomadura darangshiensis]TDD85462.1 ABC transporter permease [Actinomadura darangshiensis]
MRAAALRDNGIVVALAGLVIALSLSTDTFLTKGNLVNVLDQAAVVGLLACGMTLCIVCGMFDLSVSAVLAVSAVVSVLVTKSAGVPAGYAAGIATGTLMGTATGLVVALSRVHSFIATLALSIVYRGLAVVITGGAIVYPHARQLDAFQTLSLPTVLGGITAPTLVLAAVAAACWLLLAATVFGRGVYAVGGNAEAARLSGIRTVPIRVAVFAISGACAGTAGLVMTTRAGSAQAGLGTLLELTAIAAVVIGGTSIFGGEGAVWRCLAGALILTLISNGFNLLGWDSTYKQVIEGLLILAAVTLDRLLRGTPAPPGR